MNNCPHLGAFSLFVLWFKQMNFENRSDLTFVHDYEEDRMYVIEVPDSGETDTDDYEYNQAAALGTYL